MEMRVIKDPITRKELEELARAGFGDLVKAVVDAGQGIMAVGGELHADEEALLMEKHGSKRDHLWGINLYPGKLNEGFIEFDSMINVRPSRGNRSRGVENPALRAKIQEVVSRLVRG